MLYQITLPYGCFCVETEDGVITKTDAKVILCAPMAHWSLGKQWGKVEKYYLSKGAKIEECKEE